MAEYVTLFSLVVCVGLFGHSVWLVAHFAAEVAGTPGIGRIETWALFSLKLWALLVAAYFAFIALLPGRLDRPWRLRIAAGLAVYLVVQGLSVNIALRRWRNNVAGWRLF